MKLYKKLYKNYGNCKKKSKRSNLFKCAIM